MSVIVMVFTPAEKILLSPMAPSVLFKINTMIYDNESLMWKLTFYNSMYYVAVTWTDEVDSKSTVSQPEESHNLTVWIHFDKNYLII